eukprot:tig00021070_g17807.t1
MPQLESVVLFMGKTDVDCSPLLSAPVAESLRSLRLIQYSNVSDSAVASFTSVVLRLSKLERLELELPTKTYVMLATQSLKQWSSLKDLSQVGSDIPSLPKLIVRSPLPFPNAIGSITWLRRDRGELALELVLKEDAARALDAPSREALELLLLHVKVSYVP